MCRVEPTAPRPPWHDLVVAALLFLSIGTTAAVFCRVVLL